jgi:hypothetical protein
MHFVCFEEPIEEPVEIGVAISLPEDSASAQVGFKHIMILMIILFLCQ